MRCSQGIGPKPFVGCIKFQPKNRVKDFLTVYIAQHGRTPPPDWQGYIQMRRSKRVLTPSTLATIAFMSSLQLFDLSNKTALVTGGTGFLGRAFCDALADAGARVVIAGEIRINARRALNVLAVLRPVNIERSSSITTDEHRYTKGSTRPCRCGASRYPRQ